MQYKVTADGKWDYSWRRLDAFSSTPVTGGAPTLNPGSERKVLDALNGINTAIVAKVPPKPLFHMHFQSSEGLQFIPNAFSALTLRFKSKRMSKFLGHPKSTLICLTNRDRNIGTMQPLDTILQFQADDYQYMISDPLVLETKQHIIIKPIGEAQLTVGTFTQRWKEKVQPFFKGSFLIVSPTGNASLKLDDNSTTIAFSPSLAAVLGFRSHILFGEGTFEAESAYSSNVTQAKEPIAEYKQDEWMIDIYGDTLRSVTQYFMKPFEYNLLPRAYDNIPTLLGVLTKEVTLVVRQVCREIGGKDADTRCKALNITFALKNHYTSIQLLEKSNSQGNLFQ